MSPKNEFTLIDGKFTVEQTDQVLTALINYKIDFHNREDFSNHIRFNNDLQHSKIRVNELQETKKAIKTLVSELKESSKKIKIYSTIIVTVEE